MLRISPIGERTSPIEESVDPIEESVDPLDHTGAPATPMGTLGHATATSANITIAQYSEYMRDVSRLLPLRLIRALLQLSYQLHRISDLQQCHQLEHAQAH